MLLRTDISKLFINKIKFNYNVSQFKEMQFLILKINVIIIFNNNIIIISST